MVKGDDVPLHRGRFLKSRNHIQRKAAQRHHGYQLLRNVCHKALENAVSEMPQSSARTTPQP